MNRKSLIALCALALMALGATAQTNLTNEVDIVTDDNVKLEMITPAEPVQETEQEIKEREKRLREFNDDIAYAKASNSIRRGYFVLVADYVQIGNTGYRHYDINPNSNFILVQGDDGIVQYAINTGVPGSNGLGGWTGKGSVRNKHLNFAENGDVFLQYQLISSGVNATIEVTLFHNGKRAIGRILGGPEIVFYGEVLPYRDQKHR